MSTSHKKQRNRPARPSWSYDGATLEMLRSNPSFVTWAQSAPEFRDILTALVNERTSLTLPSHGSTENMQLGIHLGVDRMLAALRSLATGTATPSPKAPEPSYEPERVELNEHLND